MQLSEVFLNPGGGGFEQLVRGISIGKLKTYKMYDGFKTRAHLAKVNTENLRKITPKLLQRRALVHKDGSSVSVTWFAIFAANARGGRQLLTKCNTTSAGTPSGPL